MPISLYYVDPAINADSGSGTIGDPWGDLQYALNNIVRDSTNGDQICIKAGAAEVLTASLSLATYGTPTVGAPLVLRGYTAVANDGGVGDINCSGFTTWAAAYNSAHMINLKLTNVPGSYGTTTVNLGQNCLVALCEFGGRNPISLNTGGLAVGNYITSVGAAGIGINVVSGAIIGNYVTTSAKDAQDAIRTNGGGYAEWNICVLNYPSSRGISLFSGAGSANHNIIYQTTAGTVQGIYMREATVMHAMNNIICGYAGVGGGGIQITAGGRILGRNAFWNNTVNYGGAPILDLGGDVVLTADPFTDAAHGDFSLTAAAKAALRSAGWPQTYLGAHANTITNLNIGPIQTAVSAAARGRILGG